MSLFIFIKRKLLQKGGFKIPQPQENFRQWFIVDHDGKRFAKYPFGSGLIYSVGIILFNNIDIMLPILAVLNILLIFLIARHFLTEKNSLIIALISFFNPFFIINSSLFLSHGPCLLFSLLALLFFIKTIKSNSTLFAMLTGLSLGMTFNTRPLTAVAFSVPLIVIGTYFIIKNNKKYFTSLLYVILGFTPLFIAYFLYNKILTGDYSNIPFLLWSEFDSYGFGTKRMYPEATLKNFYFFDALNNLYKNILFTIKKYPLLLLYVIFPILLKKLKNKNIDKVLLVSFLFIAIHLILYFFHWGYVYPLFVKQGNFYYFNLIPFFSLFAFIAMRLIYKNWIKPNSKNIFIVLIAFVLTLNIIFDLFLNNIVNKHVQGYMQSAVQKVKNRGEKTLLFIPTSIFSGADKLYLQMPSIVNSPNIEDQKIIFIRDTDKSNKEKIIKTYGKNRSVLNIKSFIANK